MTKILVLGLLFSVLFLPNIALSSSFAARPEDLLILVSFIYLAYRKILFNTFYSWILILMFILFLTSIGINERLLSINSFEFYNKIIKGLVSYTIFLLFMQEKNNYQLIIKFLVIALVIYIIGNILQLIQFPFISILLAKYSNAGQMNAMERAVSFGRLPRLTGFIGNPNNNAVFFVCMVGVILDLFFIQRKRIYILILLVTMVIVVFTQSRTMFISLFLIFGVVVIFTGRISLLLGGAIFLGVIKAFVNIPYLDLLFNAEQLAQTNSVTGRLKEWANLMEMIKQQPWLGFGGYKEYFYLTQTYPENEYILAWFRYGVIYVLIFIGMMLISSIMGMVSAKKRIFGGYFMLSTNLALLISSISNTPFNNPRLFIFYSLVQAIYSASLLYSPQNRENTYND